MRLTRVTLFLITLIMGAGFYRLTDYLLEDLEAQTLQATEETMIDAAHILANLVENDLNIEKVFERVDERKLSAKIFVIAKEKIGLNAYLTDKNGIVLFDSAHPENVGKDFSEWSDVYKTLRGKYGARSTREDESESDSSVMFVGAPVSKDGIIVGCLSVYKSQKDVLPFVQDRRQTIIWSVALIGLGILALIVAVFIWLFRPIGKLTAYARAITRSERRPRPQVGVGREVNTLANALHDMRESLEGRQYAECYIQTLTHELKSPLAAIQGAAELLNEEMPQVDRAKFVDNIRNQTKRCEVMIHQLLELSTLEAQSHLENSHQFDLAACGRRQVSQLRSLAESTEVTIESDIPKNLPFFGNEPLLGSAITHLLENGIQFSPKEGIVFLSATIHDDRIILSVRDQGNGIPDFAAKKAFERFYSFRSEERGKGNGLGLTFVHEVAELHQGKARISRLEEGGTEAAMELPMNLIFN